jgi:amino acid adenylation domain-containing protein
MSAKTLTVTALFHDQVALSPDSVAVIDGDLELTYRQLAQHANRLSHRLIELGCRRGDRVGLRGSLSADSIVAMLAILTAGAAYVPLEPFLPDERLRQMAADSRLRAVVVIPPLAWQARGVDVLPYSLGDEANGDYPSSQPSVDIGPDDLMYVPYTSGSTGQPKGVEVPHCSIPGFYLGEDYAQWGPGSRAMYHSSMSWDGHVFEIYPALLSGGTVLVYRGDTRDSLDVVAAASQYGVSVLLLATQAFNTVAAERPASLAGLVCLVIAGEAASVDHVERAMTASPDLRIVNAYGPVECTCLATAHVISRGDLALPAVPIGRRRGDREVHLLDDELCPVAAGRTGEIYLGGPAVARGYLDRPAHTAERFMPDPFGAPGARLYRTGDLARCTDGIYDFAGRTDDQLKLRGFRIEPGEINVLLRAHPEVSDAVTLIHSDPLGSRLVSYVVPDGAHVGQLRGYLREKLPEAMVPAVVIGLRRFATSRSGKLDRLALPAPPEPPAAAGDSDTATKTELRLADAWQELVGGNRAGRSDDFFDLGGDSMLATRLIARIRNAFGIDVALREIYDHPVLGELASAIDVLRTDPAAAGSARGSQAVARP